MKDFSSIDDRNAEVAIHRFATQLLPYIASLPKAQARLNAQLLPELTLIEGYIMRDPADTPPPLSERDENEFRLKVADVIFQQSREGILVADAQHKIVQINQAFTDISGYSEEEVLGSNPRVLSSGRHAPEFYQSMWRTIESEGRWSGEIWNRHKNGNIYPEWITITALRNRQNRVTHYVASFSDLSDVKAAEKRIERLSNFDALTGLANGAQLKARTDQSIAMMQRSGEPLSMLLIGIDRFKSINDTLGHQIGDDMLIEVASRLNSAIREQDIVARVGGKEFVLVLPNTPASGAAHLARKILGSLGEPCTLSGHDLSPSASIGMACFPNNGLDFESLFKAVEIALHRAQADGQDALQFYSDGIYQEMLLREQMVSALRVAASLEQLSLVYQPFVDLLTGQISGMEALLRWRHAELGVIPPSEFIPLAEESGLIKGIGEWVIRQACRDIQNWQSKGLQVPHVAVNISALQFEGSDLVLQVQSALADFDVAPDMLHLEVTESALMGDVQRSESILRDLKALGIKLSLDDFGTGYSSLSYLKRFPFDKVKIDQSFLQDITITQSDHVIVKVIIAMAHGLGLKVIAEGVENEAQCEIMRTNACDEIQGYFFSKPISALEIEAVFAQGRQLPSHLLSLHKPPRTILLVDDEPNIVSALKRLFRKDGHQILTANSGAEGLDILSKQRVDLIISDQRMPGMTGVEFLRAAKVNYPDTIRIVLSGYTELQSVTDAINEGAVYRFLTKPWDDEQLRAQVQKAFELTGLHEENRKLDIKIRAVNQELVAANRQLNDLLNATRTQANRERTSLEIVREVLEHIPSPVIGVDDEGLIAFVNAAAQQLFKTAAPLLGNNLSDALPAIDEALGHIEESQTRDISIDGSSLTMTWGRMGAQSLSRGILITFVQKERTL
jgi:diguanylate cyclase (GGDEF)-like protein/PAS domain S-box-containing protein